MINIDNFRNLPVGKIHEQGYDSCGMLFIKLGSGDSLLMDPKKGEDVFIAIKALQKMSFNRIRGGQQRPHG